MFTCHTSKVFIVFVRQTEWGHFLFNPPGFYSTRRLWEPSCHQCQGWVWESRPGKQWDFLCFFKQQQSKHNKKCAWKYLQFIFVLTVSYWSEIFIYVSWLVIWCEIVICVLWMASYLCMIISTEGKEKTVSGGDVGLAVRQHCDYLNVCTRFRGSLALPGMSWPNIR